jgi:RNA polymerase sigma-70 factor, ECF subfamily
MKINNNCNVPQLWLDHKESLKNYIRKRISDKDAAEDILQEVLIKVFNFCSSKSGVTNVRSWLFQIAQNSIVDYYRKQGKFSNEIPELESMEDSDLKEAEEFILPMINFLPVEYAEPLIMSDIEGMKQADIAQRLGLGISATKSRIQRARQLLKKEFMTCCNFEVDKFGNFISFDVKESCEPLQKIIKEKK